MIAPVNLPLMIFAFIAYAHLEVIGSLLYISYNTVEMEKGTKQFQPNTMRVWSFYSIGNA